MIYFTQEGDTAEKISALLLGRNDKSFASLISRKNQASFATQMIPDSVYLASDRALWIPHEEDLPQAEIDGILSRLDWIPTHQRAILAKAQRNGIDVRDIVSAHQLTVIANQETKDDSIGLIGTTIAADAIHSGFGFRAERGTRFVQLLQQTKNQLKAMAEAGTKEARLLARQNYGESFRLLNQQFQTEMKQYHLSGETWLRKPRKFLNRYKRDTNLWEIWDDYFVRDIEQAARFIKWGVRGMLGVSAGVAIYDVMSAYKEGKDWIKEAMKESADMGSFFVLDGLVSAALVILELTPVGWVGSLVVGAIVAGGNFFADHFYLNPKIEALST